jgi:hypothetical protein
MREEASVDSRGEVMFSRYDLYRPPASIIAPATRNSISARTLAEWYCELRRFSPCGDGSRMRNFPIDVVCCGVA